MVALVLIYILGRLENMGSKGAGLLAMAIAACSVTQDWYARAAYPVAMASAILASSLLVWSRARYSSGTKHLVWMLLFGAALALLLLTYLAWYPLVASLIVTSACYSDRQASASESRVRGIVSRLWVIGFGFTVTYLLGVVVLTTIAGVNFIDWFTVLFEIQKWGATFVTEAPFLTLVREIGGIIRKEILLVMVAPVALLLSRNCSVARSTFSFQLTIAALFGLFLATLPAITGVNTLYERNLVGYVLLLVIALGLIVARVIEHLSASEQNTRVHLFLLIVLISAYVNMVYSRSEMLSIEAVLSWLQSNNADVSQVVSLIDLAPSVYSRPEDNVVNLPHIQLDRPSRPRLVLWDELENLVREKPQLRYLLLTNFYMQQVKGKREILLWNSGAFLAEFSHPEAPGTTLRFYDLKTSLELRKTSNQQP